MQWNPTLLKKVQHRWFVFAYVFDTFSLIFPLFMSKSESLLSLFSPSLFFKEQQKLFALFALSKKKPWANCSHCSLQKSEHEQFAPVALYKKSTWAIFYFLRANCSFAHKNDSLEKNEERIPTLPVPRLNHNRIFFYFFYTKANRAGSGWAFILECVCTV